MDEVVRWAAPILTTIAALMTASNLGSRVTGWGFGVFLAGSILWTWQGVVDQQSNLIVQNVILSLLNLFGMWRWLGRQARIDDGGHGAHERSRASAAETLFPVSLLTSAPVEGPGGEKLGSAVEAMAGCASGRIDYLVVGEGGVAGVGEKLHRLEWDQVDVRDEKIRTHHLSLDALQQLTRDNWPAR